MIRRELDNGKEIDYVSESGFNALHMASGRGFAEIVELLLDNGANVSVLSADGRTALDIALELDNVEVVQVLQAFLKKVR